jgi:hypothetical protein
LYEKLDKRKTFVTRDFLTEFFFHSLISQVVCDYDKLFWNLYCGQLGGCADGGTFKLSSQYRSFGKS